MVGWRMKVRMQCGRRLGQESWIQIPGSRVTPVMRSFAPAFIHSFLKYLWTVSFVSGSVRSARDKEKTCSHGA